MDARVGARPSALLSAVFAILLAGSLWLAAIAAPPTTGSDTGGALGRAGFAYLGGLRTFAAAVLWNRLDPIFHEHYNGVPLAEQRFAIPSLHLVTLLDPQFTQAYYLSSYMVGRMVGAEQGIELAREGVRNNPDSGLMHSNLAQLLYMQDKTANREEILEHITKTLDEKTVWANDDERFEGYIITARMLETMGFPEDAARIDAVLERMRQAGLGQGDHDHDGDGVQDH